MSRRRRDNVIVKGLRKQAVKCETGSMRVPAEVSVKMKVEACKAGMLLVQAYLTGGLW